MTFPIGSGSQPCALLEICPSLSILEKFQHSSALPNIKYNCALLFWSQLYWVFIYV